MTPPKSLIIRGGRIFDPSQNLDLVGDLFIRQGKIEAISPQIAVSPQAEIEEISAVGMVVTPGWFDMHTHLREPGGAYKETIRSGTLSAAAGGFTSVACMANTNPVNDNAYITAFILQKVAAEAAVRVYPIGAITKGLQGEELAEFGAMKEAGIVAVSDDGLTVMNAYLMRKAFDYSRRFDLPVITHCEDSCLKGKGVMNEGFNSAKFGLRGIPRASEDVIVARDILLAELTGAHLHVAHVSTRGSVELIREAKRRGVRVTAEVTPHHLTLTDEAVGNYDTNTKVAPPLREQPDIEALIDGLADGTIDAMATDHAPHSTEDKQVEYDHAAFGMIGFETAFPVVYRQVLAGRVSLARLIDSMTLAPARILGLPKGTLKVGSEADVTVFDPNRVWRAEASKFRSKSKNSPFDGWQFKGRAVYTIVGGNVAYSGERE